MGLGTRAQESLREENHELRLDERGQGLASRTSSPCLSRSISEANEESVSKTESASSKDKSLDLPRAEGRGGNECGSSRGQKGTSFIQ